VTDVAAKPDWFWRKAPAEAAGPASRATLCPEIAACWETGADEGGVMRLKFARSADAGADFKDCGFAEGSPAFNVEAGIDSGTTGVNSTGWVDCESTFALNAFAFNSGASIGNELSKVGMEFVKDLLRGLISNSELTLEVTLAARASPLDLDLKLIRASVVEPDRTPVFASTRAPRLGPWFGDPLAPTPRSLPLSGAALDTAEASVTPKLDEPDESGRGATDGAGIEFGIAITSTCIGIP
jgi:hypothetical protein